MCTRVSVYVYMYMWLFACKQVYLDMEVCKYVPIYFDMDT